MCLVEKSIRGEPEESHKISRRRSQDEPLGAVLLSAFWLHCGTLVIALFWAQNQALLRISLDCTAYTYRIATFMHSPNVLDHADIEGDKVFRNLVLRIS